MFVVTKAELYAYKVYQTKSFSASAKDLYISQPALSGMIKKLEAEIGYELFDRSNVPVSVTPKGQLYIEYLENLMKLRQDLDTRILLWEKSTFKKLSIGGANTLSHSLIPKLCKEFHRHFPDTELTIDIDYTKNLYNKLSQGNLDLMIDSCCDTSKFNSVLLWEEKYIIAARNDCPGIGSLDKYALSFDEISSGIYRKDKEISDPLLLKDIPLFRPGLNSTAWTKLSGFLSKTAPVPYRIASFRNITFQYRLMCEGLGAVILPQSVVKHSHNAKNLKYYVIGAPENFLPVMIVYAKDIPLSENAEHFISIAKKLL